MEFRVSATFGAEIELDGAGGAVRDKQANKEVGMTARKTGRIYSGHERELVTRRSVTGIRCNRCLRVCINAEEMAN